MEKVQASDTAGPVGEVKLRCYQWFRGRICNRQLTPLYIDNPTLKFTFTAECPRCKQRNVFIVR